MQSAQAPFSNDVSRLGIMSGNYAIARSWMMALRPSAMQVQHPVPIEPPAEAPPPAPRPLMLTKKV